MCGIVGSVLRVGSPGAQERERIARMRDTLLHRGPDDVGLTSSGTCTLGHARLSVIDIEGGHQPMSDISENIWVVFNGEIYNFQELREDLEREGAQFRTQSDTEVLIHLYRARGVDFLEDLDGMYGLALWDKQRQRLVLARDPAGEKPLYWSETPNGFIFASELRALLKHPDASRSLDRGALRLYLRHDSIPAPRSIYRNIQKIEPGCHLVLDARTFSHQVKQHYALPVDAVDLENRSFEEAKKQVRTSLIRSVESRLISDVPLGLFLSGGIDSTLILWAMRECIPSSQIKTFSIGFEDPSYDESNEANLVAKHFGTHHRSQTFSALKGTEAVPQVLAHLDEPFADPSIVPTWMLSEFAREHVTVALGGDGGDELFLGYPTFQLEPWARAASRLPKPLRKNVPKSIARLFPHSDGNMSTRFKLDRLSDGLALEWPFSHFAWITGMNVGHLDSVLTPAFSDRALSSYDSSHEAIRNQIAKMQNRARDPMNLLSGLYARLYLASCVLQKVDRASMAHGLEVRAPFLAKDMIHTALGLETSMKSGRGQSKRILRSIAADLDLPREIVKRPKKGFGIPVSEWLKGPLKSYTEDLLLGADAGESGVLRVEGVQALWSDHLEGRADHRKNLWPLICFRAWERNIKSAI
jgi:asparagine synthase (glutamine-hydrolysing)